MFQSTYGNLQVREPGKPTGRPGPGHIPVLEIGRGASPDVFYVQLLLLQG